MARQAHYPLLILHDSAETSLVGALCEKGLALLYYASILFTAIQEDRNFTNINLKLDIR